MNKTKAGSTVPVKFSLGGNYGEDVLAEGYPLSEPYACSTTSRSTGHPEPTRSVNGGELTYDSASDTYTYLWKTDKTWTGCRELVLRFVDGTAHSAFFDFR